MCMNSCIQQTFCVPYQSTKGLVTLFKFLISPLYQVLYRVQKFSTKYYTEYKQNYYRVRKMNYHVLYCTVGCIKFSFFSKI